MPRCNRRRRRACGSATAYASRRPASNSCASRKQQQNQAREGIHEGIPMKTMMKRLCGAAMIAATAIGFVASANAQGDQQVLVDQATTTLNNFMRDPEMKWLQ